MLSCIMLTIIQNVLTIPHRITVPSGKVAIFIKINSGTFTRTSSLL